MIDNSIKLIGFDYSSVLTTLTIIKSEGINIQYAAPELLMNQEYYSDKSDVFSYGMILLEAILGSGPWPSNYGYNDIKKALQQGKLPEIPNNCHPFFKLLLEKCLNQVLLILLII